MSFAEIVECVKQLTLEEKLQLHTVVAEDINQGDGMPPGWFTPGMVAYVTPQLTMDEANLRKFYEFAGMPVPK